jgi:hypothetical protein
MGSAAVLQSNIQLDEIAQSADTQRSCLPLVIAWLLELAQAGFSPHGHFPDPAFDGAADVVESA